MNAFPPLPELAQNFWGCLLKASCPPDLCKILQCTKSYPFTIKPLQIPPCIILMCLLQHLVVLRAGVETFLFGLCCKAERTILRLLNTLYLTFGSKHCPTYKQSSHSWLPLRNWIQTMQPEREKSSHMHRWLDEAVRQRHGAGSLIHYKIIKYSNQIPSNIRKFSDQYAFDWCHERHPLTNSSKNPVSRKILSAW